MLEGVLNPQGPIALQERHVIITAVLIMLTVAIPLLVTLYIFAWKYRAGNKNAQRTTERKPGVWREIIWWLIPAVIVVSLGFLDWKTTHQLDPSNAIVSNNPPITIQVIALQWKWLFIYPAQGIATVNFIEFPEQTPVRFELTADAPMSSFWIPQLGSQIYAMQAMQTQLNLMANSTGEYVGKDTEINGDGYAGMTFLAKSVAQPDFDAWVASVKEASTSLTMDTYNALALPSEYNPQALYSSFDKNLYDTILMKYMTPGSSSMEMQMEMPEASTSVSTTTSTVTSSTDNQSMPDMPGMSGMNM